MATQDQVRGMVAQVRSNRFKLQHAIESVDNQIALLRANIAALETRKANLTRAKADYDRAIELAKTPGAIAPQDVDQKREAFDGRPGASRPGARSGLSNPRRPRTPRETGKRETTLRRCRPISIRTIPPSGKPWRNLLQSAAPFGVFPQSYNVSPKEAVARVLPTRPQGNLDRIYANSIKEAPTIKLAQAKRDQAKSDLDQAELNLRYCDVVAEIDGVITRRNVNPGNNVQAGEGLMAIRSLTEIWVDANFKETQLRNLRIGQRADLEVDMYGSHKTFQGRITGFTMGTGSTLALLPAAERDGQLHQGRAAVAGAHRPDRLRSRQRSAVHRPVGRAPRLVQGACRRGPTRAKCCRLLMSNLPIVKSPENLLPGPQPSDSQPTGRLNPPRRPRREGRGIDRGAVP